MHEQGDELVRGNAKLPQESGHLPRTAAEVCIAEALTLTADGLIINSFKLRLYHSFYGYPSFKRKNLHLIDFFLPITDH